MPSSLLRGSFLTPWTPRTLGDTIMQTQHFVQQGHREGGCCMCWIMLDHNEGDYLTMSPHHGGTHKQCVLVAGMRCAEASCLQMLILILWDSSKNPNHHQLEMDSGAVQQLLETCRPSDCQKHCNAKGACTDSNDHNRAVATSHRIGAAAIGAVTLSA